jgi:hypothetical protein
LFLGRRQPGRSARSSSRRHRGRIDAALDAGLDIPPPTPIDQLRKKHKAWRAWVWALVEVDPAAMDDTVERVNISLPRRVLRRLDTMASSLGETRSGFIARMALERRAPA